MSDLEEAAEELARAGNRLEDVYRKFDGTVEIERNSTVKEKFLKKDVENLRKDQIGTVAGIDGGVVKKRYSSGDLVGTRSVSAIFNFSGGLTVDYLPGKAPEPEFNVFKAHESDSLERNAESERLREESDRVLESIQKADRVLLDGSLVPSYLEDEEVLENYARMFRKARKGKLIGVVEDSYGLKLAQTLEEQTGIQIGDIRDTLLMDGILEEGERSFVRRYSSSPVEHPVLKKLPKEEVNKLHTFYVKPSSKDIPLRIDYYGIPSDADRISSILCSLSSSEKYVVPTPILEADKRAKIADKYLQRLENRFSADLRRRDRRSF